MFGSKAKPSIPVAMAQSSPINKPPTQEKIQATTTTLVLSETTETTETGAEEGQAKDIAGSQVLTQKDVLAQISNNTRNQVETANKVISGLIILLGIMAAAGVILQQRTIAFGPSELVLRSAIIIILGISFTGFHLENLIGHLMIP